MCCLSPSLAATPEETNNAPASKTNPIRFILNPPAVLRARREPKSRQVNPFLIGRVRNPVQHRVGLFRRKTLHLRRVVHRAKLRPAHGAEGGFLETLLRQRL